MKINVWVQVRVERRKQNFSFFSWRYLSRYAFIVGPSKDPEALMVPKIQTGLWYFSLNVRVPLILVLLYIPPLMVPFLTAHLFHVAAPASLLSHPSASVDTHHSHSGLKGCEISHRVKRRMFASTREKMDLHLRDRFPLCITGNGWWRGQT